MIPPPVFQPPTELDEYRLVRPLGRGGMGEVWLAHDTLLDRQVAVKFIAQVEPDATLRSRFFVEARAVARLSHPNVVTVHRVGELQRRPYIVSEFVRGNSLDKIEKPVPWPRLLPIAIGLARGLAAAHRAGVLHRDIKPANAILGDDGEVKLLDFGLAKLVDAGAAPTPAIVTPSPIMALPADGLDVTVDLAPPVPIDAPRATTSDAPVVESASETAGGALFGTPLYMSPEAWRSEPATRASDVYSLGVVLFEILALDPLFPADASAADIFNKALIGIDASPAKRAPHRDIPPELDAICVKACQPAPESRYATARELHDAIDRYLAGDRDVEQRRMLAASHVGRAQDAAKRALSEGGGEDDRKLALREAGRALALDPDNDHAVSVLLELLTQTPKVVPDDVVRAVEQQERATGRRFYVVGGSILGLGALVVFVPILLGMGVRSPLLAWLVPGLWILAAAMHLVGWVLAGKVRIPWTQPFVIAAVMSSALLFGPFVFVPAMYLLMRHRLVSERTAMRVAELSCTGVRVDPAEAEMLVDRADPASEPELLGEPLAPAFEAERRLALPVPGE